LCGGPEILTTTLSLSYSAQAAAFSLVNLFVAAFFTCPS